MRINLAHGAHASSRLPAYQQLPLWRDSNRLLVAVENAVHGFPRYHKYALGADLRRQAMRMGRDVTTLRSVVARLGDGPYVAAGSSSENSQLAMLVRATLATRVSDIDSTGVQAVGAHWCAL